MDPADRRLRRYFRFFRPDVDEEVDEELRHHLELLEEMEASSGASADESHRRALARFGDVRTVQRELRRLSRTRVRRVNLRERASAAIRDLRLAARRLRRAPFQTAAVIAVLGLGVGGTATMFSAVDAAFLRPLPFPDADRLVVLPNVSVPFALRPVGGGGAEPPASRYLEIGDLTGLDGTFSATGAFAVGGLNLAEADRPLRLRVGVVTRGFFPTIGVSPALGRAFSEAEGAPGGPSVVVLSDGLWRRHYGGEPMIGRTLQLSGRSYEVIGIMPPGFRFPGDADCWIPLTVPVTFDVMSAFRNYVPFEVFGRLAPGVSLTAARSRLAVAWERVVGLPETGRISAARTAWLELGPGGTARPLQRSLAGSGRTVALLLFGATGLLLLVAAANAAGLLAVRATARRRELATLAALGADRPALARQLVVETLLLAGAAVAVGVFLARAGTGIAGRLLSPALATLSPATVDGRVVGFAALVALVTGLGASLWPIARTRRVAPIDVLRSAGEHGSAGRRSAAGRRLLMGFELALTLPLLVGTGLALRSLVRLLDTDVGFDGSRVATATVPLSASRESIRLAETVVDQLAGRPGIEAAGVINDLPLSGAGGIALMIERAEGGQPVPADFFPRYLIASEGYFRAMSVPLLRGRLFTPSDNAAAPRVAVINASMARRLWGEADPVGRSFWFTSDSVPLQVIGVVGDVRETGLEIEAPPQFFLSAHANRAPSWAVVAKGTLSPAAAFAEIRSAVAAADPSQPIQSERMMADLLDEASSGRRQNAVLISVFGGLALVITGLGVFGVVTGSVAQRRRELGIRLALGANGGRLARLVLLEVAAALVVGLGAGLAISWTGSRLATSLVYGITAADLPSYLGACLVLVAAGVVACVGPVRRVLAIDPTESIRVDG